MRKLFRFLLLWIAFLAPDLAHAAARFWVPAPVSGAVSGTGGVCNLTVPGTNGYVTGNTITVAGVTGATGCNVTTTLTVIDGTHIELDGTTFGGTYVSGGLVSGGNWTSTNTANWAATSGGTTVNQSVPVTADSATFDANSGSGTATVSGYTPSVAALNTAGSVTGLALGSNGITVVSWTNTSGTSAINMGSGTVSVTATSGNVFLMASSSNVTASSATIAFSGTSSTVRTITFGTISYGSVTFATNSSNGGWLTTGACTIGTLSITAPNTISFAASTTYTITNALALAGSSGSVIALQSGTFGTSFTLALGAASTCEWCSIRDMTNTTNSFTLTNSFNLGRNTFTGGGSISPPSGGAGGGGRIIGG